MIRTILTAAVFAMAATAAHAGDFQVAKHGSYLIDLDTADGHFSLWQTQDVADIDALRAHVTFANKGGGEYAPQFTIHILSGEKSVDIRMAALPKSGPLIGYTGPADEKAQQLIVTPPNYQEPFDLRVRWTPDGKVSFDIYDAANKTIGQGFEHHEAALGGPVTGISITNSTGEVEFNKLELGTEAP